jgi:TolA-binding protein
MKSQLRKTVVLLCLPVLARCVHKSPDRKAVVNPIEDRMAALEIDLRDQSREIARLQGVIQQLKKSHPTERSEETLGSLIKKTVPSDETKPVPTLKLKPEESEFSSQVSPLMADSETIVDSSQELMQNYYRGLQLATEKKYDDAIDSFRLFIEENPNHIYADRAQYLIADSYFRNKEYGMVVVATNLLETKFPYSLKLPEALYRRGLALIEMNQKSQAKLTFSQLVKNFPKEPVSLVVRKKWSELGLDSQTQVH